MLPHLLEVLQTLVLSPHDGRHPAQGRPLELLAPVEGVSELEEPDIVLGHVVNQVTGGVDLTQGQLVMILEIRKLCSFLEITGNMYLVVEHIHEVSIEGVDVFELGEFCQY